ncbi:hypothetical protein Tco_1343266 [Tanacetum coccineum]
MRMFGKSGENELDVMKRARLTYRDENKNTPFSQEDAWEILRAHSKWDAPEPVDLTEDEHAPRVNNEELFGLDARPHPPGKQRPGKKTKSDTTTSNRGSSLSSQFGEFMTHELRLKREAAEKPFEGDKLLKDKGQSFGSEGDDIDQYDSLFLHSNDTNGIPLISFKLEGTENYKVWKAAITIAIHTNNKLDVFLKMCLWDMFFSKNAKTVWDELEETYSKQDASVIFNVYYKIHSLSLFGSPLSEYYHKFNALWRQYDSLVNLPDCICENSEKLKKHNQLLKLMQFLMGLDEVYAPIKSIILTTDHIPDVKGAFVTLSKDESHRSTQSHNLPKLSSAAFVAKTNNRFNNWSSSNNQTRRLNRPNLVCTHCNMNDYAANRCFELVGHPPLKEIMLNMIVGHPNGTKALVTHVGSLKLTDKIVIQNVIVVPDYQDYVLRTQVGTGIESNRLGHPSDQVLDILKHKLNFETNSNMDLCEDPYNNERDSRSNIGKGINQLSHRGTKNTGNARRDKEGHPDDSIPDEATCDDLENAIPDDINSESEGDDIDYQDFNDQFQRPPIMTTDKSLTISQSIGLRRSTRKTSMPVKLSDFEVNTKVKYNIDRQVNYSKLSIDNYNFSTNLNKISEPQTYEEAASDIRWVEAMNQEMEALNRNGTWIICNTP